MYNNQRYEHIKYMRVGKSTMVEEVLILAEDVSNVYFIRTNELDEVDRTRVRSILGKRNANNFPLWDLLDQTTLGNGKNALEYFHQLAYVQNAEGDVSRPGKGFGVTRRKVQPAAAPQSAAKPTASAGVVNESVDVLKAAETVERKGRGRPPKANTV